jgi:hypothetical protein
MPPPRTEQIPVFRYTITLLDGTKRETQAIDFGDEEEWTVFHDTIGTTRRLLRCLVAEVERGEQVAVREVDAL